MHSSIVRTYKAQPPYVLISNFETVWMFVGGGASVGTAVGMSELYADRCVGEKVGAAVRNQ